MLPGGHDVDVHLMLRLPQALAQPRAPGRQPPADKPGMDSVEALRGRENTDVLGVTDVAIGAKGQRPDHGERNALFRQSPPERFESRGNVAGVPVVPSQLLDERPLDWSSHDLKYSRVHRRVTAKQ